MAVRVVLAAPLDECAGRFVEVEASGDVKRVLDALIRLAPDLRARLKDGNGELYPFINIYLNGENVVHLKKLRTPVRSGDEILIVPAVAGG